VPAKLLIQLLGEATSAVGAIKKTEKATNDAAGAATKTTSAWSGVGKAVAGIGAAFAATAVVGFAKDAVGAASDLNESWSKVGVVFGSSAGMVQEWSKTSATSMGLSQQAALEAAGTYGNLAVALGLPTKTAADMSTKLVGLAGDLASFNNVPVGDALDALKSGLTGEAEPLRRFGVSISAARVEAEAMRLGLAKAPVDMAKVSQATGRLELAQKGLTTSIQKYGKNSDQAKRAALGVESAQAGVTKAMGGAKVNLTDAAKAQATYSLILKDTKTAQGDFARTSGGLANQQRISAAEFQNMKATLGQALLPVLTQVFGFINSTVMPILTAMSGFLRDNATAVQVVVGAIVAIIAVFKIWTLVVKLMNIQLLASPWFWLVAAIVALVVVIVLIATKTTWFQQIWAAMCAGLTAAWRATTGALITAWNAVWSFFQKIFSWIARNWPLLLAILTGPFGLAVLAIIRNWQAIVNFFTGLPGMIGRLLSRVGGIITAPFMAAWGIIYRNLIAPLSSAFSGVVGAISGALSGVTNAITAPFTAAWDFIQRYIVGPLKSVWNGIANTVNAIHISVTVPDWIPGIGGKGWDWRPPHVPTLARGAYVTRATLGVFGEAGPELVLPEGRLRQILGETRGRGEMVRIEHAHFSERVDVDTFGKRLAWQVATAGV
jgi:hypothetical protein